MQALFSTMPETAQQPMTDFRRVCLEAEEKKELDGHRLIWTTGNNQVIHMPVRSKDWRMSMDLLPVGCASR